MLADLKDKIETSLSLIGEVEAHKKPHRKGGGQSSRGCCQRNSWFMRRCRQRQGQANRLHYVCSNPKCQDPIRQDKWDTHVLKMTTDLHLQEKPEDVLERSCNFAPDGDWDTKESRMQRVVTFMEQRRYLALARQHDEKVLAQKITDANHFYVRLTNMVRAIDPTSEILLSHYARHFTAGSTGALADLILNIMFLRNTMSKEVIKMCGQGKMPWLTAEAGCVSEDSKRAVDEVFLALGGKVFFQHVEPMSLFYRRICNRVERRVGGQEICSRDSLPTGKYYVHRSR